MVANVRDRLMEAIKIRLRADVPLGIYLSGGIDSSAVAGMVAHLVKEEGARLGNDDSHLLSRIKCFTVQFDKDSGADESGIGVPIPGFSDCVTNNQQILHSARLNGWVLTSIRYTLQRMLLFPSLRILFGTVKPPCQTQMALGDLPWPRLPSPME